MTGKMHTLLGNLDGFLEVLAFSQSVHVKDWDILSIQRGFEWGVHFQHVHKRFIGNDLLRNAVEERLHLKNKQLSSCMKNYQYITFNDLKQSKEILCMSLLQNKALPKHVLQHLLTPLSNSEEPNVCCLNNIMSQKVAAQLLFFPLSTLSNKSTNPLENPFAITEAELLRCQLENRMKLMKQDHPFVIISEVLEGIPQPSLFHQLVIILLSDDFCDSEDQASLTCLLLKWLLENDSTWTSFCRSLNAKLLVCLSSRYAKVGKAYLNFLTKLGESLEQDALHGKWISSLSNLSFDILLDNFKCLMNTSEDLWFATETMLKDLKSRDGNYTVPGISIWTDLLLEINKQ
ncbi:hypothetical protein GDO86_015692 [Hymenochirus boettgeri]|uniref:Fanconi anemia group F protein n=1 Tax=Hymenochirus boettgeri TaxID=247094 RepID=A0A8T2JYY8_9PIPI|nr:hypothetical protein GDO86_015692 [Hymenochirus boettgeri]